MHSLKSLSFLLSMNSAPGWQQALCLLAFATHFYWSSTSCKQLSACRRCVCLWLTAVTLLNAYIKPPWLWSGVIRVYITSSEPLKASLLNHWVIKRIVKVKEMWSPAEGKRVEFLDLRHLFGLTSLPQSNTKNVINRICLNAFYI